MYAGCDSRRLGCHTHIGPKKGALKERHSQPQGVARLHAQMHATHTHRYSTGIRVDNTMYNNYIHFCTHCKCNIVQKIYLSSCNFVHMHTHIPARKQTRTRTRPFSLPHAHLASLLVIHVMHSMHAKCPIKTRTSSRPLPLPPSCPRKTPLYTHAPARHTFSQNAPVYARPHIHARGQTRTCTYAHALKSDQCTPALCPHALLACSGRIFAYTPAYALPHCDA